MKNRDFITVIVLEISYFIFADACMQTHLHYLVYMQFELL